MKDWCDIWAFAAFEGDGGGGSGADAPGVGGAIGAEAGFGNGFGADATGAAASDTNAAGSSNSDIGGALSNAMSALDPMENPAATALGFGLSSFGFSPISSAMTVGAVMGALGGTPDTSEPGSGVGSQGDVGGGQIGGADAEEVGGGRDTVALPVSGLSQSVAGTDVTSGTLPDAAPIALPEPEPAPEPELSDSEEAQRLRRARRYFGLSGTNVTGPLGLQSPAPVFRPSATPVVTTKRKLGA